MKYSIYALACVFLLSCNQNAEETEMIPLEQKIQPLSQLELSVKAALTEINKSDLELIGNKVYSLDISGMEIIKISRKDYFIQERNTQETVFNNYLKYLERFKNTSSPLNNPSKLADSKMRHAGVLRYLDKMIKQSSLDKEIYKVAYYLKANTRDIQYNQLQTTYLDTSFKSSLQITVI